MSHTTGTATTADQRVTATLAKLGPTVVRPSALMELLQATPNDATQVLHVLQADPTLAARVLSVLNSAAIGLRSRISSLPQAVALLGPGRARSIGLAYGLRQMSERSGLPRATLETLWANALTKACAARLFCQVVQPDAAEEAYAAALMQDIGLPMLMAVDPDFYATQIMHGAAQGSWVVAERERFGIDHAQISQRVLEQWDAPSLISYTVGSHHWSLTRLPEQRGNAMLFLSSFLAGLLPHGHEEPTGWQRSWLDAIHVRFLAPRYPSPDQFMLAAIQESRSIGGQHPPADDPACQAAVTQLIAAVGDDMIHTVTNMVRLEQSLGREREGLLEMREQAFTDPLTRLLNRRGFATLGERRLRNAIRDGSPVCVMLADLDDFKKVNDTHGHDRGDRMLRAMAKLLRRNLRRQDLIGRLGGDEFAVVLADIDAPTAHQLARQLVQSIEGQLVRLDEQVTLPISFSLGAAAFEKIPEEATIDAMLTVADQALYQRKRCGKRGMSFVQSATLPALRAGHAPLQIHSSPRLSSPPAAPPT